MLAAGLLLVACGGKKDEAAVPDYSNMLGLWMLQEPQLESKWEIMFNEDSTGFIFVADTFHCGIAWQPDSALINVDFLYKNYGLKYSIRRKFNAVVDADTLWLQEIAADGTPQTKDKYLRYKQ